MSDALSSFAWTAIGTPLANHLWQSTLFAAVAGLVTLLLRKNRAQVRYWLWLAASLKFLVPFSLLITVGARLAPAKAPAMVQPTLTVVVQQIGQPFAAAKPPALPSTAKTSRLVPAFLFVAWFSGCAGVLLFWWLRWRHITRAAHRALPLASGREFEAQRRLERSSGVAAKIKIATPASVMEPGVIGIFRPVLVVPAGIADRLTDAQLEAILLHELCHVRRRDNLAAAIHMLVEAVFWFHPLVWWIGARLVDERERACDEEVLRLGSEPQVYAEGILKVCEFYLESPLVCVAGVTGSNLKKRIEVIMTHRIARNLDFARKLLLAAMGMAVIVVPIAIGFLNPISSRAQSQSENVSPVFASVSIKPHPPETDATARRSTSMVVRESGSQYFVAMNATLESLIESAYDLKPNQISGGPDWLATEAYDIRATIEEWGKSEIKTKLQNLLADRFKLKFHLETKEEPVYELVVGTNGLKLKQVSEGKPGMARIRMDKGHLDSAEMPMNALAGLLSNRSGRMVFDKTGLKGNYEVNLDWTPGNSQSIATAVHEQLGLELKPQTAPIKHLTIDSAEKPITDTAQARSAYPSQGNGAVATAFADTGAAMPVYEIVSIKPDSPGNLKCPPHATQIGTVTDECGFGVLFIPSGFLARITPQRLIAFAYGFRDTNISGAPDWANSETYDIEAKLDQSATDDLQKLSQDRRDLEHVRMLQALLADRFKLAVHRETKEVPVYALLVGENGPRLQESALDDTPRSRVIQVSKGQISGKEVPVATVASILSEDLGRAVLDKTELKGHYDIALQWPTTENEPANSSLFAAVQEQLGLKLEPQKIRAEVLVIDHVETPTEN